jgi:hypothetical protein
LLALLRRAAGGTYDRILSANAERLYGWA